MRRRGFWEASEAGFIGFIGFIGLGSCLNRDLWDFLETMSADPQGKVATTWGTIKRSL